jgi:hypothetical protein
VGQEINQREVSIVADSIVVSLAGVWPYLFLTALVTGVLTELLAPAKVALGWDTIREAATVAAVTLAAFAFEVGGLQVLQALS